jgi:[ribosomal protein S18]-alanine N-acetyltransferase
MKIFRLSADDGHIVMGASSLFDVPPDAAWTTQFLSREGHHLLAAMEDDRAIGFVTGVETTHPDKGTEMFLYELAVHPEHRKQGIGTALVGALAELARSRGCYGMWVSTEPDNVAALATYRAAGATPPEESLILTWTFERHK